MYLCWKLLGWFCYWLILRLSDIHEYFGGKSPYYQLVRLVMDLARDTVTLERAWASPTLVNISCYWSFKNTDKNWRTYDCFSMHYNHFHIYPCVSPWHSKVDGIHYSTSIFGHVMVHDTVLPNLVILLSITRKTNGGRLQQCGEI